jgi:uncharacterized protein (TIGR03067 family)
MPEDHPDPVEPAGPSPNGARPEDGFLPPPAYANGPPRRDQFDRHPHGERASPRRPPPRFQGGSLRLFRVAGIDVFLHWSWLIVAYFQIQHRAEVQPHYDWPGWLVVEYLALFGIVLLHEFGHALACRSVGGTANRIVLWPLGGVALVNPPPRPGPYLWTLAAGPLVNVALAPVLVGVSAVATMAGLGRVNPDLYYFLLILAGLDIGMLAFNLMPIFPLDGGQILHALLWFVIGRAWSLLVLTIIGLVTATSLLLVFLGVQWWWFAIIAAFAAFASLAGLQRARGMLRILNAPRREGLRCPSCQAVPPAGDFWLCTRCMRRFDLFEHGAVCPVCGSRSLALCPECYQARPLADWYPEVAAVEPVEEDVLRSAAPPLRKPVPRLSRSHAAPPPSVLARAAFALVVGGITFGIAWWVTRPNGLTTSAVLGLGGAMLGATVSGVFTRGWTAGRARGRLRGTWLLVEEDSAALPDHDEPVHLVITGDTFSIQHGGHAVSRGTIWLDPLRNPKRITFIPQKDSNQTERQLGIYEIEGKVLTLCLAEPGKDRPEEFGALPERQRLLVYQREQR